MESIITTLLALLFTLVLFAKYDNPPTLEENELAISLDLQKANPSMEGKAYTQKAYKAVFVPGGVCLP